MDHGLDLDAATRANAEAGQWASLWEAPGPIALLNHGSFGRPFGIVRRFQRAIHRRIDVDPAGFFRHAYEGLVDDAAHKVREFLGVPASHGVAFRHNASTAVLDAVGSFVEPGRPLLDTSLGYGGVAIGLESLAGRIGASVVHVDLSDLGATEDSVDILADAVERHRPGVVVIDEITSGTALHLPVVSLVAAIRGADPSTRVVVDAAHSAGMLPAPALSEADAWVTNLHKWVCAPHGAAVIVAPSGSPLAPLQSSWTGAEPFPGSFSWVGTDDITAFLAAPAAFELLTIMRRSKLHEHITRVLDSASRSLATAWDTSPDIRPAALRAPWMRLMALPANVELTTDSIDRAIALVREELRADVAITMLGDLAYLRLSAHGYSTSEDFDRILELPELLGRLSSSR
jgi:isopenicillin-N epimerase